MLKKIKSKGLIILLILSFLINTVSCKSNLTDRTVKGFLDSVKNGDISKATEYLFHDKNSADFITSIFTFDNDQQKELALKTFSNMNYKIISTSKVSDSIYKVKVEIENVDFVKITDEVLPEIIEKTDDSVEQTEAEINRMVTIINDSFIAKLSEPAVSTIKNTIEIELFKDMAITKISIMPNEDLLNSISGNLAKAYDLIEDSQAAEEVFE